MKVSPPTLVLDFAGRSPNARLHELLRQAGTERPLAVVVPAWFGLADRHQVATSLDPHAELSLALVSSTLAGVYGHPLGDQGQSTTSTVLCLDVRCGWSAGLILVEPGRLTEIASWGASPDEPSGRVDDAAGCRWLVDHLSAEVSAVTGTPAISSLLVMDDGSTTADLVRRAVGRNDQAWAGCPVSVKRGRQLIARGAVLLRECGGGPPSVGALSRALAVRADDSHVDSAMHVITPEHSLYPSTTRQTFDLGPNDGSPLHFDVYEQRRDHANGGAIVSRAVLRAHLVRERGYDRNIVVTFELGGDGLFRIGPARAWSVEWQPGSLDPADAPAV